MRKNIFVHIKICFIIVLLLLLCSCAKTPEAPNTEAPVTFGQFNMTGHDANAMNIKNGGGFCKLGTDIYTWGSDGMIYRFDTLTNKFYLNCTDPMCSHNSLDCSADCGMDLGSFQQFGEYIFFPSGETVNNIWQIAKNSKNSIPIECSKKIDNNALLFDNKIAFFGPYVDGEEEDPNWMVKPFYIYDIVSGELNTIEDCKFWESRAFYHENYIYWVTPDGDMIKFSVEDLSFETIQEDTQSVIVYKDKLYFNKIETVKNATRLSMARCNLDGSGVEILAEKTNSFNIKNDTIYYTSFPEKELYMCDLDGKNSKKLLSHEDIGEGLPYAYVFEDYDKIIVQESDINEFYTMDLDGSNLQAHVIPANEEGRDW